MAHICTSSHRHKKGPTEASLLRQELPSLDLLSVPALFTSHAMSPPVVGGKHRESAQARLLGSGLSGVAELMVFHPVDTVAKRLMSNKDKTAKVSNRLQLGALLLC